jgi:hypothetical protein
MRHRINRNAQDGLFRQPSLGGVFLQTAWVLPAIFFFRRVLHAAIFV